MYFKLFLILILSLPSAVWAGAMKGGGLAYLSVGSGGIINTQGYGRVNPGDINTDQVTSVSLDDTKDITDEGFQWFGSAGLGFINTKQGIGANVCLQWDVLRITDNDSFSMRLPNWGAFINIDYHSLARANNNIPIGVFFTIGGGFIEYYDGSGSTTIDGGYTVGGNNSGNGVFIGNLAASGAQSYVAAGRFGLGIEIMINDSAIISLDFIGIVLNQTGVMSLLDVTYGFQYESEPGVAVPQGLIFIPNTGFLKLPAFIFGYPEIKFSYNFS